MQSAVRDSLRNVEGFMRTSYARPRIFGWVAARNEEDSLSLRTTIVTVAYFQGSPRCIPEWSSHDYKITFLMKSSLATPYFLALVIKLPLCACPSSPTLTETMADVEGLSAEEIARIAESRKKRSFKKFTFRGVDLDKLLDLTPEELLPLFTSRVRRRLQRPLKRKHKTLIKKLKNAKKNTGPLEKPAIVKTHLRDLVITPELIGSIVAIYNGKLFNPIEIKPEMVGMYTGEFSMSYRWVLEGLTRQFTGMVD